MLTQPKDFPQRALIASPPIWSSNYRRNGGEVEIWNGQAVSEADSYKPFRVERKGIALPGVLCDSEIRNGGVDTQLHSLGPADDP